MTIQELKSIAEAATPGPWAWRMGSITGRIDLFAPHGGGTTVMDFARKGMHGAQPRFAKCNDGKLRGKRGGALFTATELIEADPDKMLRHPDAELIAAMNPKTALALIAVAEAAKAADRQLRSSALQPDSDESVALRAALDVLEAM